MDTEAAAAFTNPRIRECGAIKTAVEVALTNARYVDYHHYLTLPQDSDLYVVESQIITAREMIRLAVAWALKNPGGGPPPPETWAKIHDKFRAVLVRELKKAFPPGGGAEVESIAGMGEVVGLAFEAAAGEPHVSSAAIAKAIVYTRQVCVNRKNVGLLRKVLGDSQTYCPLAPSPVFCSACRAIYDSALNPPQGGCPFEEFRTWITTKHQAFRANSRWMRAYKDGTLSELACAGCASPE